MSARAAKLMGFLLAGSIPIVILYAIDPSDVSLYPPCVFHLATGLLCPGCGLTRAAHELLHGNVAGALELNALLPVYALLLGGLLAGWVARQALGSTPRVLQMRSSMVAMVGIVIVGFGVLRNLL